MKILSTNTTPRVLALLLLLSFAGLSPTLGSNRKLTNKELVLVGAAKTINDTITLLAYHSNHSDHLFSGGNGKYIDVFKINCDGKLTHLCSQKLTGDQCAARGMIASKIGPKDFLFVGNKMGNAIEVFKINSDGSLKQVHIEHDNEQTQIVCKWIRSLSETFKQIVHD